MRLDSRHCFFLQAEDGIRDLTVTGVQTCALPIYLGPAQEPVESNLNTLPEATWVQPAPDGLVGLDGDPAEVAASRETIRLAFVAALQHRSEERRVGKECRSRWSPYH